MKEIVLKVYKFDELSKDSQEKIIERERWNVMEQCMDAYSVDYKKSMKAFEDMTDTEVYDWSSEEHIRDFKCFVKEALVKARDSKLEMIIDEKGL